MIKLVVAIIFCLFVNLSYAHVDNRPGMTEPIVKVSNSLLVALDAAIKECKYRGFNIELAGVKVYKNTKNYIFDFGTSNNNDFERGAKSGAKMIVVVDMNTFNIIESYYPK